MPAAVPETIADPARCGDDQLPALILRMSTGDESALSAFYDLTLGRVYGLALRITGRPELAEEVSADVYLQCWRQAGAYRSARGSVMAWLMMICRSRALDALRRRDPAHPHPDPDALRDGPADGPTPPDILSSLQSNAALYDALTGLSEDQRQVIALAFFQDLSHQEIAERLGKPLGTVKSHLRRAQIALRAALGGESAPP